jgi:hypothetical protein
VTKLYHHILELLGLDRFRYSVPKSPYLENTSEVLISFSTCIDFSFAFVLEKPGILTHTVLFLR